jgi:geranyl-CoA carboxylase alpha subunit
MLDAGVPCVPGYQGEDQSDAVLLKAGEQIGVPLMVKAAAGGGGRGMRLVRALPELPGALASARSEAQGAFGSGELILEKAVLSPRHVEIQVFGDAAGNIIHLGERDCSVQRRHQKVVEEAPCPVMTPSLRDAMGAAAVAAARSINYVGAGTVEFLLEASGAFYFLEMNTRLQVEHPVTEMVTGLDLVALQLQVAQGGALPLSQEELRLDGHAIEVRLYAEDVYNDFLPASGTAMVWKPPQGEGLRVDDGLLSGQQVSPYYDPMVAKIIAAGADREQARRRLVRALHATELFGLPSNRQFLIDVLERPVFAAGCATTAFIEEEFPDGPAPPRPCGEALCCAALLQFLEAHRDSLQRSGDAMPGLSGFSPGRELVVDFAYEVDGEVAKLSVQALADGRFVVSHGLESRHLTLIGGREGHVRLLIDGMQLPVSYSHRDCATIEILYRGSAFTLVDNLARDRADDTLGGSGSVLAPMHGNLLKLSVGEGDRVRVGDELAVVEAMKMEHRMLAEVDGIVKVLLCAEGQQVAAGAVLLEIEADSDA